MHKSLLHITIYSYCYNAFRIGLLCAIIIDIIERWLGRAGKHGNIDIF